MKIQYMIAAGIVGIIIIGIFLTMGASDSSAENRIRVAFFPNIGHAIPIVGLENEIFADGLNQTTIDTKLFDSGPQAIESLFADSIDIAYVGPGPAVNGFLKSENQNIVILAGAASGGSSFVVHPNSDIESVDDFAGKRIAAPQIANTQDVSLRHYLYEHGFVTAEHGGSVYVLNVPNPEIYTLFTKADIDAAWVPEPWATIFVQELDGKRLFYEEELWNNNQFSSVLLVARADYVEEHPEIISRWLDAHNKTASWINSHKDESGIIFNNFMQKELGKSFSDAVVKEALANIEITSDPVSESIEIFAERANSLGYLGRHGYDLNGIFYNYSDINLQELEKVTQWQN